MKRLIATLVITSTCASIVATEAYACPRRRSSGYRIYSQPQHFEPAPQYHEELVPYYVTPGSPYGPTAGPPGPMTGQPFVDPSVQGQPFTQPTFEGQPGVPAGGQPFTGQPGVPFTDQAGQPFTDQPSQPFSGQPRQAFTGQPEQPAAGAPFSGPPGEGVPTQSGLPTQDGLPVTGASTIPGAPLPEASVSGQPVLEATLPAAPITEGAPPATPVAEGPILPPTVETSTPIVEPAPVAEIARHEVFMSLPLQLTAPGSTDLPGHAVLRFPGFEMPLTVNLWQEGLIEVQMPTMTFAGNMEATLLLYRADRTLYAELPLMLINAAQ